MKWGVFVSGTIHQQFINNVVLSEYYVYIYKKNNIMKKGCVYFFKHKGWNPIKIGYSSHESPSGRFEQFKTYAPFGCEIVGFIKTYEAKELETKLHKQFKSFRLKGEWFSITEEVVFDLIDLHSSNEQKEELYNLQKIYAKQSDERNMINEELIVIDEFFDCIDFNTKQYTSEILQQLKTKSSPKKIFNELKRYCESRSLLFFKGRDSKGRYFIITH